MKSVYENKEFNEIYDIKEELGKGGFSVVHRCIENSTNKEFAVKVINTPKLSKRDMLQLESEARICQKLDHPSIVKLHKTFNEDKVHYFIFDLVTGGELFDDIVQRDSYTEGDTAICMYQMLSCVRYIHAKGVVHRDLKPENILLESKEHKTIKVADFGLAIEVTGDEMKWFGIAGTPGYMAPEVLEMVPYGKPVDLWACGVIFYILLSGTSPFYDPDQRKLDNQVKNGDYDFNSPIWDSVTDMAKELITKLMCVVPSKRITAADALQHPWFSQVKELKTLHSEDTLDLLRKFNARRKFKAAAVSTVFARSLVIRSRSNVLLKSHSTSTSSLTSIR